LPRLLCANIVFRHVHQGLILVIVTGWFGLGAAKQYLFSHPGDSLAIYESQSSLGGTWAEERLYPDLKTNNLVGTFEFPDFPMDAEAANVQPGQHVPGRIVNAYLKAYAQRFGVDKLVHLNTKVTLAEHQENTIDGGWILTLAANKAQADSCGDSPKSKVFTRRLIMATGLTSEPFAPRFRGQDEFGGRIFHGKYWPQNSDTLRTAKAATIFGNSKFAWDAVYSYAKAGVDVHWVIRGTWPRLACCLSPFWRVCVCCSVVPLARRIPPSY
jgi:cation diffusion facilitator CzcD-associated flavoprotein CzcO